MIDIAKSNTQGQFASELVLLLNACAALFELAARGEPASLPEPRNTDDIARCLRAAAILNAMASAARR